MEKTAKSPKQVLIKIGVILFLIFFVAALAYSVLRYTTGVIHRLTPAVKVEGRSVSAMDLRVIYTDARANYLYTYGSILQMYGVDLAKMDSQTCLFDNSMTWAQYFLNQGINQAANIATLAKLADNAGYKLSAEDEAEVERYLADVRKQAEKEGVSLDKYLATVYGKHTTIKDVEHAVRLQQYANGYYDSLREKYASDVTDEAIETYYAAHKDTYDSADYYSLAFPYEKVTYDATKTDSLIKSEEEATQKTEEAKALAKTQADDALAKLTGDNFDTIAAEVLSSRSATDDISTSLVTEASLGDDSAVINWVKDAARTAGDTAVIEDAANNRYVLLQFVSRYLPKVMTADVRHVLFETETAAEDATDEAKAAVEAANAEVKAKAEQAYEEWKKNPTEDALSTLAKELSADTGSASNGGLYEGVAPGRMVEAFDNWLFADGRQPGDHGLVETTYGFHIMYYVGEGGYAYANSIKSAIVSEKYDEYYSIASDGMEADYSNFGIMLMYS